MTPLETGMYWVKHVAKNKGASHLRSVAVELTFFQLYNVDVWAFICGVLILATYVAVKSLQLWRGIRISAIWKRQRNSEDKLTENIRSNDINKIDDIPNSPQTSEFTLFGLLRSLPDKRDNFNSYNYVRARGASKRIK